MVLSIEYCDVNVIIYLKTLTKLLWSKHLANYIYYQTYASQCVTLDLMYADFKCISMVCVEEVVAISSLRLHIQLFFIVWFSGNMMSILNTICVIKP